MTCNGCFVLRKRCRQNCVIRPCLEWIPSRESQSRAALFLSEFFGRENLFKYLSGVPSFQRTALFKSLLYEAAGRKVNPVNGVVGLLSTGNWHICEEAVQTVLAGGSPAPPAEGNWIPQVDESSDDFQLTSAQAMMMIANQNASNMPELRDVPKLLDLFK